MKISRRFIDSYTKDHNPRARAFVCDVIRRFVLSDRSAFHLPEDLDWTCIDRFLRQDNLKPLFHAVLKRTDVDPERSSAWQKVRMGYLRRNILIAKTASRLFSRFEQNGIAAAALRGLHLAHFIYADAGIRPMRDVDILVRAGRDQVRAIMHGMAGPPHEILRTQDTFIIDQAIFEIHYSLLTTRRFRSALDTDSFLKTARKLRTLDGDEMVCLSLENELIDVVAHAYIHHGFDRMMPLVDMALLMGAPMLDWEFVADWCKKLKLSRMFHFALAFVNDLFDLPYGDRLHRFESKLPAWAGDAFEAYACRIWGWDSSVADRLRRRTQLYVAETPGIKWRQIVRFFSNDEIRSFARLMVRKEVTQKIGMETVHDFETVDEHRDGSHI
jgi:hypothetical protein